MLHDAHLTSCPLPAQAIIMATVAIMSAKGETPYDGIRTYLPTWLGGGAGARIGVWSKCSVECGVGIQARARSHRMGRTTWRTRQCSLEVLVLSRHLPGRKRSPTSRPWRRVASSTSAAAARSVSVSARGPLGCDKPVPVGSAFVSHLPLVLGSSTVPRFRSAMESAIREGCR